MTLRSMWAGIILLAAASQAAGLAPADKCAADKLLIAGKYDLCRLKAAARAARIGSATNADKCDARFSDTWRHAESGASGGCPSIGDADAVRAFLAQHADDMQRAAAGEPLPECANDLLACRAEADSCSSALSSCQAVAPGQRIETGQTTCYDAAGTAVACEGTGQDAASRAGLTTDLVDNGDGTVSDRRTGLTWEKLGDDGSIHDRDVTFVWSDAVATKITLLNLGNFAGHADWRLPNINELQSLADYGTTDPATNVAFDACTAGCSALSCSCTQSGAYWSASSSIAAPSAAWVVSFDSGGVAASPKGVDHFVRAVRGGAE